MTQVNPNGKDIQAPVQGQAAPTLTPQQMLLREDEGESLNISDFLALCLRCWRWFALSVIVCVGLGALYVLRSPKQYTREAQVVVQDEDSQQNDLSSALSNMGLFSTSANVANELLAFQSPALLGDVIDRLGLRYSYTVRKGLRPLTLYGDSAVVKVDFLDARPTTSLAADIDLDGGNVTLSDLYRNGKRVHGEVTLALGDTVPSPIGRVTVQAGDAYSPDYDRTVHCYMMSYIEAVDHYSRRLTADLADKDASVINFTIKDTDTQRAVDLLNTLIAIYNEKWVQNKEQMAVATSNFISERLSVIEHELGTVDSDIADYKGQHLVPDVQAASELYMKDANENTKQQLEVQTQIEIVRYLTEYLKDPANKGKLLPSNLGIENQGIAAQIADYNTLLLERNQLLETTGLNNPLVKDRDAALASISSALASSLGTQGRMLQTQLNTLIRSDRATNSKIASSPEQAKYLLSVERQQKVKESLYLFLLQKREENELSLAFTPYNTRIITPPMGPGKPTSPVTRNVMIAALLIGLLIPALIIFLVETLNTRVRSRDDLGAMKAPLIGEIPEAHADNSTRLKRLRRQWRDILGKESRIESAPTLEVKPHSHSIVNEAFRMMRSNIDFVSRGGRDKVCMITSFNPGSGKSFISLNLGAAMAVKRKDARVLVIDLDLRRASMSKVVGNAAPGVADYLSEACDNLDALVRTTHQPGLYIMPVGTIPPNPSELLYSTRLQQLLESLRSQYDFILLDCPPTDVVADATIITPLADMTVFVVRAGLLDRRLLPDLNRFYDSHRFNNMMLVLNGTTSLAVPYRRYAYHNYYGTHSEK